MDNVKFDDLRTGVKYELAWRSNIGKREYQQDSAYLIADDSNVLAIICDGMGGLEGGAIASRIAVNKFAQWYFGNGENFNNKWMKEAIEDADRCVNELTDRHGKRLKAGSTLASICIQGEQAYWISSGDSRIYIFRDNEMVQVTSDHNYFWELNQKLRDGIITKEKYQEEAFSGEALISFVGMGGLNLIDMNEDAFEIQKGDVMLICSDGLYKTVPDEAVQEVIVKARGVEEAANWIEQYIREADYDWQDNYTFILIRMH